MSSRKNNLPEGDDGRVIADMNVPGMPWYKPKKKRDAAFDGRIPLFGGMLMTPDERRQYTAGAVCAALLVTLVMCLGLVLFVLFCLYVWFPQ